MNDNRTIIEKADLALGDLASGGELEPAQAKKYIQLLIQESVLLKMARVKPMKSKTENLDKIRFGTRIMKPGVEATALAAGDRSAPDLSQTVLTAKLFKAQVNLSDEVLEDQIEQGDFAETIMQLISERVALDIDELVANGDTASGDAYLAVLDGARKSATTNVFLNGVTGISKATLKGMLKAMPQEFVRNRKVLKYLTSVDALVDYRDSITTRDTVAGDAYLLDNPPATYNGMAIEDVPVFPENLGIGTNETEALLLDPKNMTIGFWRRVRMETDRDIETGVLKIVVSQRLDFKYVEETAVVKATGITVA